MSSGDADAFASFIAGEVQDSQQLISQSALLLGEQCRALAALQGRCEGAATALAGVGDLNHMFETVALYTNTANKLAQDARNITLRTSKLKAKALRLQALAAEQQKVSLQNRQRTEQLERSLLARPKFHAK